jgi:hypothetical protein
MKCLIAIVILAIFGFGQSSSQTREASQLLDRLDAFLKNKEDGWTTPRYSSAVGVNRNSHTWEKNDAQVNIYVIALVTPEEAAEALKQRMHLISVGPNRKLEGLGDEAYVYGTKIHGDSAIRFRSGLFCVDVQANSSTTLHRFSKYIDEVIRAR